MVKVVVLLSWMIGIVVWLLESFLFLFPSSDCQGTASSSLGFQAHLMCRSRSRVNRLHIDPSQARIQADETGRCR